MRDAIAAVMAMPNDAEVDAALEIEEALTQQIHTVPRCGEDLDAGSYGSDDDELVQAALMLERRMSPKCDPAEAEAPGLGEFLPMEGGFLLEPGHTEEDQFGGFEVTHKLDGSAMKRTKTEAHDELQCTWRRNRASAEPDKSDRGTTLPPSLAVVAGSGIDAARNDSSGHGVSSVAAAAKAPFEVLAQRLAELCLDGGALSRVSAPPSPCRANVGGMEVSFPFASGPLEPQRRVMERVAQALNSAQHAVLESPTGTGKTAAVLCTALEWQQRQRADTGKAPQLIFATRTHAQLRQAIAELRRLPYRPRVAVVGSRESGLCIHQSVATAAQAPGSQSVRQACREARRSNECLFHTNLRSPGLAESVASRFYCGEPWDIEDIANFGQVACACPYYIAHTLARHAEIIFCPYNYVLDPSVRRKAGTTRAMELHGRVVILDEAHNIEGVCREAGAVELGLDQMRACIAAMRHALGEAGGSLPPPGTKAAASVPPASTPSRPQRRPPAQDGELGGFLSVGSVAPGGVRGGMMGSHTIPEPVSSGQGWQHRRGGPGEIGQQLVRPVRSLIALFCRLCDVVAEAREAITYAPYKEARHQVPALIRSLRLDTEPLLRPDSTALTASGMASARLSVPATAEGQVPTRGEVLLHELAGGACGQEDTLAAPLLDTAAGLLAQLAAACSKPELYVAHIDPAVDRRALHLWLVAAEGTLASTSKTVRSLLLMSGTLAPLATTTSELGLTFRRRMLPPVEAGHVIGRGSLRLIAVGQSASMKLECTYRAWKRDQFVAAVGEALVTVASAIPGGVLVFLPSYDVLDRCVQVWQCRSAVRKRRGAVERISELTTGAAVWDRILANKGTVVVEPSPQSGAHAHLEEKSRYEAGVKRDGRAALLAVYRGRMSEGVSFDDDFARGVICIGIPFPNLTEDKLTQKRLCNDFWVKQGTSSASGDAWYESRALQAVGQALGRCIRHPDDFGALVLLDSRWIELGKVEGLPRWIQAFLEEQPDPVAAAGSLGRHFASLSAPSRSIAREMDASTQRSMSDSTTWPGAISIATPVRTAGHKRWASGSLAGDRDKGLASAPAAFDKAFAGARHCCLELD